LEQVSRVFVLSPAFPGGKRAQILMSERADFDLACRLRDHGAPLGEVFSFLSGLYFRGKLTYARAYVRPPPGTSPEDSILVITSNAGLLTASTEISLDELREFGAGQVDARDRSYRIPLMRDAQRLARLLGENGVAVLLGSVATNKYVDVLLDAFGRRLRFPMECGGRGDMSRGGLLLRCAAQGRELSYVPVDGATRSGPRPPRLEPLVRRDPRGQR